MDYSTFIKNIEKERNVKIKVKGTDVGKPNVFNKNLLILKKGLINHFVEGKDFLNTIRENQELIDYQIIKKRTAKTKYMNKDTLEILPDKVLRLFPVTKNGICIVNDKFASIPEVPDQVIIVKDNILNMTINDIPYFDINYYINAFNDKIESWTIGNNILEDINDNIYDEN